MEALKTNVLLWGMLMFSSMKEAFHDESNEIQSWFNITQRLILEHSEEILNVKTVESASPSWSSDPVDKRKSTCLLRFRTMLAED